MAKITITTTIEIPDMFGDHDDMKQAISDAIGQYLVTAHCRDAMTWIVKSEQNKEDLAAKQLKNWHENWAEMCAELKWDYEVK